MRETFKDGQLTFKRGTELYEMLDVRPWAKTEDQHSVGENCGGKAHFFFFFLRDSIQSMKTNAEWLDFFQAGENAL